MATGRHFRVAKKLLLISGRFHEENQFLEQFRDTYPVIIPRGVPGPSSIVLGDFPDAASKRSCCFLVGRYISKGEEEIEYTITYPDGTEEIISATKGDDEMVGKYIVD
jgi:hypothetical protein